MVTTNSKFLKEIKTLIASTNKALSIAKSEIDKVDAKYKALAEQEKKGLANTVKMLEAQLDAYSKLAAEETTETAIEEKEETVVDTIYPENTEETMAEETTEASNVIEVEEDTEDLPEDFPAETSEVTVEETTEEVFEDDAVSEAEELADAEAEANVETTAAEDEWPEFPTEWK